MRQTELDDNVNLGAIFVHHLVSLKIRPFTGTRDKFESLGSLLTHIFCLCGISTEGVNVTSDICVMNEAFFMHAKWIKADWVWCYRSEGTDYLVKLPQQQLTRIMGSQA